MSGVLNLFLANSSTVILAPQTISGLQLWLDGEDASTITVTGGRVEQWDDKSGNGNHVSQSNPGQRPTVSTVAGLNALLFVSIDLMNRAANTYTGLGGPIVSIFAVYQKEFVEPADSAPSIINIANGALTAQWGLRGNNIGTVLGAFGDDFVNDVAVIPSPETGADDYFLVSAEINDTTGNITTYLNGVASGTDTGITITVDTTAEDLVVGGLRNSSTFVGHLAEICVYDESLTDEDRQTLEQYFKDKWSVPVA